MASGQGTLSGHISSIFSSCSSCSRNLLHHPPPEAHQSKPMILQICALYLAKICCLSFYIQCTIGWVIIPSNAVKYTITRRLYAHMYPKAHSYMYFCALPSHIALHCHSLMAKETFHSSV